MAVTALALSSGAPDAGGRATPLSTSTASLINELGLKLPKVGPWQATRVTWRCRVRGSRHGAMAVPAQLGRTTSIVVWWYETAALPHSAKRHNVVSHFSEITVFRLLL